MKCWLDIFPKYFLKWSQKTILTEYEQWLEKTHTNLKLGYYNINFA